MRFKLDENLGSRVVVVIADAGHDVETVAREKLSGTKIERAKDAPASGRRGFASPALRGQFDIQF
jgi:hypothetical protein